MNSIIALDDVANDPPVMLSWEWMNNEYAKAATKLGYSVEYLIPKRVFRMSHQGKSALVVDAIVPLNDGSATYLADHKGMAKERFAQEGVPCPSGISLPRVEYRRLTSRTVSALGFSRPDVFPLVVKPEVGTLKGQGVVTNIVDEPTLFDVLDESFELYGSVIIEEYYGRMTDHRLLVLDGKLLAAAQRHPGEVVGDGTSTIEELIHAVNAKRRKEWKLRFGAVRVGRELHQTLAEQGFRIADIPENGVNVRLMNVANLSSGGYSVNCTDQVAQANIDFAVRATEAMGLRLAGVDVLCHDITKPIGPGNGGILEVNASPGVVLHYFPRAGGPTDVIPELMKAVFVD
ncbi:MAG: hypothetical protein COW24_04005 [Candidatus Kerfeldbacteria bacterium CG15_BIG_FIL_POST_REV_8_21_14_020_45_12]|uniref:ATP-grasp domain-containing protein n=1 Tax=Candidatus Kerfeldbacteria bacterium CG15_BIG_FIL_POST_REV_8_21_14_020_45_12 TaxID=2014247 RepID=A0A2M7H3B5_9BACT|nr:MAG: hypothetical protein COW24_04005 [Candidatus Kerfeldbacteria bacterium CG15_BIG_FIL_POST_REV_8_21_14_020_45_12]PJA93850.1 MAG: hypothetical protein CO132_01150 [Candidatus Kerfeldbacteria bacterium CG_4_9_14_3_um_filter_45_8]